MKGLKKNLLFLGQLDRSGCKTHVQDGIMKIIKGALVVMKTEKIAVNLYMFKGEKLYEGEAFVAVKFLAKE